MIDFFETFFWLIRDPHIRIPDSSTAFNQLKRDNVVVWRPFNRPLWPPKIFHVEPFRRTLNLFSLLQRHRVPWEEFMEKYEAFKKEVYGG